MNINGLECDIHEPKEYTKNIIMCNGFNSSKNKEHYILQAKSFADAGYRILQWDYRSHTSNLPTKTLTEDLNDCLSLIDWLDGDVGIYGSSWGGQIALQAGVRHEKVKSVVLRVPVTNFEYFDWHTIEGHKSPPCAPNFWEDIKNYNTYEDAKKRKIPTLIFSGLRDESCPVAYHKTLFDILPEPKKHIIFDMAHGTDDESIYTQFIGEVIAWFKEWL